MCVLKQNHCKISNMTNLSVGFLPFLLIVNVALAGEQWGYGADDGPSHWKGTCQTGTEQSPIDLDPRRAIHDHQMGALHLHGYEKVMHNFTVTNNGHTVIIQPQDDSKFSAFLEGGGLPHKYEFMQLHFHWGKNDRTGSEHTVKGHHYPLEMHLVHKKAGSENPKEERDGLAVLGVFFKPYPHGTHAINHIVELLPNVKENGASVPLNAKISLRDFLPNDLSTFYRYMGSLTTPGCDQAVVWTVFAQPVPIRRAQLRKFGEIKNSEGQAGFQNFRPTQKLNGRKVILRAPPPYRLLRKNNKWLKKID